MYRIVNKKPTIIIENHNPLDLDSDHIHHINDNSSSDVPELVQLSVHHDLIPNYKEMICMLLYDDALPIDELIEQLYFGIYSDVIIISLTIQCVRVFGWMDKGKLVTFSIESLPSFKTPVLRFNIENTNILRGEDDSDSIMGIKLSNLYHRCIIYSDDGVFSFNRTLSTLYEVTRLIEWPHRFMGFSLDEVFEHLGNQIQIVDIRTETKENMNVD